MNGPFSLGKRAPSRVGWVRAPISFVPRVKLFCFHHAGGSAIAFRGWQERLAGTGIEVIAAELPGRGRKMKEQVFKALPELISYLFVDVRREAAGTPIALFGVSLGALIAYELAVMLEGAGNKVNHLVASSFCAPPLFRQQKPVKLATKTDEELTTYLRALGGTPEELLAEKEWREFFFAALRADFHLLDIHTFPSHPKLSCPITVIGATEDEDYPPHSMEKWAEQTTGKFDRNVVSGGHLYLVDEPEKCLSIIRRQI